MSMTSRAAIAAAALAVLPGTALAGVTQVPTTGTESGTGWSVQWTTLDPGTCSQASGTAVVEPGPNLGCSESSTGSPQLAVTAFGSVWLVGGGVLQAVNPSTSAISPTIPLPGIMVTLRGGAAAAQGSYLWIAGAKSFSNGATATRVVAVNSSGAIKKTFTSSPKKIGAGGQSIAYGAGTLWVGDSANRIYALSPSTGKLKRTITTANTDGLVVARGNLWATNSAGRTVKVFNTSTGKVIATRKVVGLPNAVVASGRTVYVFSESYLYAYSSTTLKQTGRWKAPASGSGWLGAVVGPGGLWASNYVAKLVRFNTATKRFDVNVGWSNQDTGGPLASAGGMLWVPNPSSSPFPTGHSVTRFALTP